MFVGPPLVVDSRGAGYAWHGWPPRGGVVRATVSSSDRHRDVAFIRAASTVKARRVIEAARGMPSGVVWTSLQGTGTGRV